MNNQRRTLCFMQFTPIRRRHFEINFYNTNKFVYHIIMLITIMQLL